MSEETHELTKQETIGKGCPAESCSVCLAKVGGFSQVLPLTYPYLQFSRCASEKESSPSLFSLTYSGTWGFPKAI